MSVCLRQPRHLSMISGLYQERHPRSTVRDWSNRISPGRNGVCRESLLSQHRVLETQQFSFLSTSSATYKDDNLSDHDECSSPETATSQKKDDARTTAVLKLEAETARLIGLIQGNSDQSDKELPQEIGMVDTSDVDRVLEQWYQLAEQQQRTNVYANTILLHAAERAEALLVAMEVNHKRIIQGWKVSDKKDISSLMNSPGRFIIPNEVAYNMVVHAYAMCSKGDAVAATRAQAILDRMLANCREYCTGTTQHRLPPPPEPSAITFNSVCNVYAKSGQEDAGKAAESVFTQMEEWYRECQDMRQKNKANFPYKGAAPNHRTVNCVIDAWAKSTRENAPERVMAILHVVVERCLNVAQANMDHGDNNERLVDELVIQPNVIIFNSAIHAWAKSGRGRLAAEKAEDILDMLDKLNESGEIVQHNPDDGEADDGLKPNTRTLSLVLEAWACCAHDNGDAAERAEKILNRMEELYNKGFNVKPNYISFTTCITAWARSKENGGYGAERAQAILDRMLQLYESSGDKDFMPSTTTINSVITAWARSQQLDAPEHAEAVLRQAEAIVELDTTSYNAVLDAYAKSSNSKKAEQLLEHMENSDVLKPDLISYNTVLGSFGKAKGIKDGEKLAEALLNRMEKLADHDDECTIRPDLFSYTSVMNAYAMGSDPDKAQKVHAILQKLIELCDSGSHEHLKPDVFAFTIVINACAYSLAASHNSGKRKYITPEKKAKKRDNIKLAISTMTEFRKHNGKWGKGNHFLYNAMILACSRLSSDQAERGRLLDYIFTQCCQEGLVSRAVLNSMSREAPINVKKKHLTGLMIRTGDVPQNWYCNVRNKDWPIGHSFFHR
eukprot:scaffold34157_cov52-Attheya_sp.AAC.2